MSITQIFKLIYIVKKFVKSLQVQFAKNISKKLVKSHQNECVQELLRVNELFYQRPTRNAMIMDFAVSHGTASNNH